MFLLIISDLSCLTLSTCCFLNFSIQTFEKQHIKRAAFPVPFCYLHFPVPLHIWLFLHHSNETTAQNLTKHLLIKLEAFQFDFTPKYLPIFFLFQSSRGFYHTFSQFLNMSDFPLTLDS